MIIHKFAIHVLDKNSDVPILNDYEGKVSLEVDKLFQKLIKKVSKDSDLRKGIFKSYQNNIVKNCCEQIIYDEETFLENSKEIASYLFEVMKINSELESCDLAICLYTEKDEKYVAIIKLDYKKLYNHYIEFKQDKFNIQMIGNEIGISENQKINYATIIGANGINDEYHLKILDKLSEKENIESKFVTDFLDIIKIKDSNYFTKEFKASSETWIINSLSDDIKQAENVRSFLNYTLKEKDILNLDEFIESAIENKELRESFKEYMEDKDIDNFDISKKWVEKNLKKRTIKTDGGFTISGNLEEFEDPMKFSVKSNEDGSIDMVIKNIRFYQ